jgi:hypothetical protein
MRRPSRARQAPMGCWLVKFTLEVWTRSCGLLAAFLTMPDVSRWRWSWPWHLLQASWPAEPRLSPGGEGPQLQLGRGIYFI